MRSFGDVNLSRGAIVFRSSCANEDRLNFYAADKTRRSILLLTGCCQRGAAEAIVKGGMRLAAEGCQCAYCRVTKVAQELFSGDRMQ